MNINEAFPSKYLKADVDILPDEPLNLTIKSVSVENVGSGDKQENKPIVSFVEHKKGLVLNKTNATTITKLYGADTDGWAGKRITLLWKEVEYQGEMRPGIRVSLRAPAAAAPATNSTAPLTDAQRWAQFIRQYDIQPEQIKAALNYEKVSEWLAATAGDETPGTLAEAMRLILAQPEPTAQIPF